MRLLLVGVSGFLGLLAMLGSAGAGATSGRVVSYPDTDSGAANAADITAVTVSSDHATVVFRIDIDRLVVLPNDVGVEVAVDTDRNASTGFPWVFHDLGAEYMAQILGGVPRLLRWNSLSGRWTTQARPTVSSRPGEVVIAFKLTTHGAFDFVVSTGSNMVAQPDGTFDITNTVFDFAPDRGYWRYR